METLRNKLPFPYKWVHKFNENISIYLKTGRCFLGGEKLENIDIKEIIRSKEEKRILIR